MEGMLQARSTDDVDAITLRVAHKSEIARNIWLFELRSASGEVLPTFSAGSHIPVQTPRGQHRNYSLCNDPNERDIYAIAVKRDASGGGGSISMADELQDGDLIQAGHPRNHFELSPRAKRFIFIAGGIGITPILSMMRFLKSSGNDRFVLHYCTAERSEAAFADEIQREFGAQARFHHDHRDPDQVLDLWPVLEKPSDAHIYCCGPRGLMDSVRDMSGHWPSGAVHFESFGVAKGAVADNKPFKVRLARSGALLDVAANETIMEVVRANGIAVASSCENGVCGACRTKLVEGEADHRDMVLMEGEKAHYIMPCVSRAKSCELVLDL